MPRVRDRLADFGVAAYAVACLVGGVDARWHHNWDSALYLLTARSLAAGEGYRYLGEPFFLRPPGFSYLLSWFVPPAGGFDFYRLNLLVMALAMSAVAAAYLVLSRVHGKPRAAAITLAFGTSPLFVSHIDVVLSEFLFLALLFAALAFLLPNRHDGPLPLWRHAAGAIAIAAALYVRTAGIVLVPALVAVTLRREAGARKLIGVAQAVLVLILVAPWLWYSARAAADAPKPATQLLNFTYATPMLHVDGGDPRSPYVTPRIVARRTVENVAHLARDVGHGFGVSTALGTGLAALVVALGFVVAARRGWSLLEWFAASYAVLLATYAYYDPRLVLPLVPFFFHYGVIAVDAAAAWCARRFVRPALRAAIVAAAVGAVLVHNLATLDRSLHAAPADDAFALRGAVDWIRAHVPPGATVLADSAPQLAVLTGHRVYSHLYLRGAALPSVDYAVLVGPPPDFEPRLAAESREIVRLPDPLRVEDIRIFRLR
jgi:hypothetical protein